MKKDREITWYGSREQMKYVEEVFLESFKSQFLFGSSAIDIDKDGNMRDLSQEEIQELLNSESITITEELTATEIIEKYSDKLTDKEIEQLKTYKK